MDGQAVKEIASLAKEEARVIKVTEPTIRSEPIALAILPDAAGKIRIESLKEKLDQYRIAPERRSGTAKALTLNSFIDLVNRHKDGSSVVFGDLLNEKPSLTAVVDYHEIVARSPVGEGAKVADAPAHDGARYGRHRIAYAFPISPEWQAWSEANGSPMSQGEFAAFIEEHVADLASPLDAEAAQAEMLFQTTCATPSQLMALSRGLEVCVQGRVKETRVLATGEAQIVYEEVHTDGQGQSLKVPGMFIVSIPLFVGADPSRLIARLRYRKVEQRLKWFFQFYRADHVVRERLTEDLSFVAGETGLPVFEGSPEA